MFWQPNRGILQPNQNWRRNQVDVVPFSNLVWRTGTTINASANNTVTYSGLDFGTAAADRWVIAAASIGTNSTNPITGMTIGGITAAEAIHGTRVHIWLANVPSGTTGQSVVITSSDIGTGDSTAMGYWTVNMASGIPTNTSTGTGTTSVTSSAFDIITNGFAVGVSQHGASTDRSHSIDSSFTERAEVFGATSSARNVAWSDRITSGTGITPTDTWSGGGAAPSSCFAAFQ